MIAAEANLVAISGASGKAGGGRVRVNNGDGHPVSG